MKLLRSLLMPIYPTSLCFVAPVAALFALTSSVELVGALRILPQVLLLSWLFKYAYAMLEQAADGISAAPIPSLEMLGPFEYRPLVQLAICILVYAIGRLIDGVPKQLFFGLFIVLLPASIGTLAVTGRMIDALNPLMLWRVAVGLGHYYLLILGAIACYAAASFFLARIPIWQFAWYAISELLLLSAYVLIGSAIYERRNYIGHEPRSSPERQQENDDREYNQRRSRMLDDMYYPIRAGNFQNAIGTLKQWLLGATTDRLEQDVNVIMTSAFKWNSDTGLTLIARCVVSALIQTKRLDIAIGTLDAALLHQPRLALDSEEDTTILASYAKSIGRKKLALALIGNFQQLGPSCPPGSALVELQRELES